MRRVIGGIPAWLGFSILLVVSGCASTEVPDGAQFDQLRAKAEQGDTNAQFQLAVAYDQGRGLAKNQTEAAMWYRKAADQGYAAAQNSLGSMYQFGEGVPQNDSEAVTWYQKAANQGFGEAYTNLGYMYDFGRAVRQDKQKAVELYLVGAEKGSLNAMLNLGVSYWKGEGVSRDLVEAYKWLDLARFYTQTSPNMKLKWRVRGTLDDVKKEMTSEQISKAQQLTREWDARHRLR